MAVEMEVLQTVLVQLVLVLMLQFSCLLFLLLLLLLLLLILLVCGPCFSFSSHLGPPFFRFVRVVPRFQGRIGGLVGGFSQVTVVDVAVAVDG